jgi:hypothetical protein
MEALTRRRDRVRLSVRAIVVVVCTATALVACRTPGQPGALVPVRMTPLPTPPANADALDCPTSTSCYLVAAFAWSDVYHWDGSSWARLPTGQPGGGETWLYSALSCPTATACLLLGRSSADDRLRLQRWDGSSLTAAAPDFDDGRDFGSETSLSCATDSWCMLSSDRRRWIWDGATLTAAAGVPDLLVSRISCATPAMCMGWADTGIVSWDGVSWTVASPGPRYPSVPTDGGAEAISCPTATFCAALFKDRRSWNEANVATWNGRVWTGFARVGVPPGRTRLAIDDLVMLSCSTPRWCVAYGRGWRATPGGGMTGEPEKLLIVWDGEGWHRATVPDAAPILTEPAIGASRVSCARGEAWCLVQLDPRDVRAEPEAAVALTPGN